MDFSTSIQTWLTRHPLKEPIDHESARYTAEVMQKVQALDHPSPAAATVLAWLSGPRMRLAAVIVAASVIVVITSSSRRAPLRLVNQLVHESSVLAELDEANVVSLVNGNANSLAHEMEALDTMRLAQSPSSDDQWIEQTVELLDQVDDTAVEEPSNDDEWLNELQLFDEDQLSASS